MRKFEYVAAASIHFTRGSIRKSISRAIVITASAMLNFFVAKKVIECGAKRDKRRYYSIDLRTQVVIADLVFR